MSEIARIREQIERECEAMNLALYGYATVASHKIIEQKYNNLGRHRENLEKHIGKEEAGKVMIEIYTKVIG
ncbi:MAG TPA: hypothetical protein VKU38_09005 [Ktedonobacteraceae bacterium]|nr:hypothetical protein [Ktedonobacteraceae bacterium]